MDRSGTFHRIIESLKDPWNSDLVAQTIPDLTSTEEEVLVRYAAANTLGGYLATDDLGDPLLPHDLILWMRAKKLRTFDDVLNYPEHKLTWFERLFAPLIARRRAREEERRKFDTYMAQLNTHEVWERNWQMNTQNRLDREAAEAEAYEPEPRPIYVIVERAPAYKPGFLASSLAIAAGLFLGSSL